jgi:hypothetical protein
VREYEFSLVALGALVGSGGAGLWAGLAFFGFGYGAEWPRPVQYILGLPVLVAFHVPAVLQPLGIWLTIFAIGAAFGALAAGGVVAYYRFKYR